MSADFTFPVLQQPTQEVKKIPLTALSTVTDRSGGQESAPPVPLADKPEKAPRSKVPLEKGYSQVDWLKLSRTAADLNGLAGLPVRKDITLAEVQQHNKAADGWLVLHGKVYNITPYLKFHPGGPEILIKALGKDATSLFVKYHAWVNADALLAKCLVGMLAQDGAANGSAAGATSTSNS